jgi:hypothetical protein
MDLVGRAKVPVVVAMQHEIHDRTAIKFSGIFYGLLAAGYPVDIAMTETRLALFIDSGSDVEWAIPALYSRSPDGIIFKRRKSTKQ